MTEDKSTETVVGVRMTEIKETQTKRDRPGPIFGITFSVLNVALWQRCGRDITLRMRNVISQPQRCHTATRSAQRAARSAQRQRERSCAQRQRERSCAQRQRAARARARARAQQRAAPARARARARARAQQRAAPARSAQRSARGAGTVGAMGSGAMGPGLTSREAVRRFPVTRAGLPRFAPF